VTVAPEGSFAWYAGFILMAVGVLVLLWGITVDGQHWWKKLIERRRKRAPELPEWLSFPLALNYITRRSVWAFKQPKMGAVEAEKLIENEVLEMGARGDVRFRGIPRGRHWADAEAATSVAIEPAFWEHAFFQPFAELFSQGAFPNETRGAACTAGKFTVAEPKQFLGILVRSSDLVRVWPMAQEHGKSSLAEAFDEYLEERDCNPNSDFDEEADMIFGYEPQ